MGKLSTHCRDDLVGLREDLECLVNFLEVHGIIRQQSFLAHAHRRKFERTLRSHPLHTEGNPSEPSNQQTLADALAPPNVGALVASFAGVPPLKAVRATCQQLALVVRGDSLRELVVKMSKIYVCGGWDDEQQTLNVVERLQHFSGEWETLPPLGQARVGALSVAGGGSIFVCGGWQGRRALADVECYSPRERTWHSLPPMSKRRFSACGGVVNGRLYICGGWDGQCTLNDGEWSVLPEAAAVSSWPGWQWNRMPYMEQGRAHAACAADSDYLYVAGGWDTRLSLNHAERWSAQSQVWERIPDFPERLSRPCGAMVRGAFVVCGGWANQQAVDWVARYQPGALQWEVLQPMLHRRAGAVTAAAAGYMYVFGGWDGERCCDTVERYNASTGEWEPCSPLQVRRRGASAVAFVG